SLHSVLVLSRLPPPSSLFPYTTLFRSPHLHAVDISADVAGSLSVITSGTRVLAVLQNLEVNTQLFQSIGIRRDRAVALSKDLGFLTVVDHGGVNRGIFIVAISIIDLKGSYFQRSGALQVLLVEDIPHVLGVDLAAFGIGDLLHHVGKFWLHGAWHLDAVVGLHDVGNATLAGLGVNANDGFVVAANILRVNGQVRNLPGGIAQFFVGDIGVGGTRTYRISQSIHALVDGILVRAGERGKDQVAA